MPELKLILLTCYNGRFRPENEKAYRQPLQTVHNSSEKSAGKNERKRKKETSDSTALR